MDTWLRHARTLFLVLTLGVAGMAMYASPAAAKTPVPLEKVLAAGYPGAVAATSVNGQVETASAGVADLRTGRKAKATDRYRIGSVTKTMTSVVVLQLVNERRLTLDTKVAPLLADHDLRIDERITVRHLLQQTSGFHTDTRAFSPPYSVEGNRFRHFTPEELVKIALTNPEPRPTPGTKHEYSNTNYVLAGLVIEKVTGNRVESELKRRIIGPLHLTDTYLADSPFIRARHLRGYLQDETGKAVLDYTVYSPSWAWTAGAVVSTVADETAFLRGLFTGRLLSKRFVDEMMDISTFGYGLGLFALPAPCVEGGLVWGHNGAVFGYQSVVMTTPDGTKQVAVGANALMITSEGGISAAVELAALEAFCPGSEAAMSRSGQLSHIPSQLLAG
jgi:D-alanyl-D-alanine carboxypeptidase